MIRKGVAKYLQLHTDRFAKIYEAENGQEAIDLILRYQPDMLLLDVQMPVKTGLDVMKEVEKAGLEPVTVILSGYDAFAYAQQAVKFGAKDYLLKPVRAATEYIQENYAKDLSLTEVAEHLRISTGYLSTLMNQNIGCGFVDFLNQVRVDRACCYLEQHQLKNYEVAYKVGFNDEKYFSKVFKKMKGMTPKEYRLSAH